jgi:type I restriction-modification system DNA methylase subunit
MATIGKKTDYASMFVALENALRNHETIIGEKALYIMTMLVAFILIEPHIESGTISFTDIYDWCFFDECHNEEEHHMKLDDLVPKTRYSTMTEIEPADLHKNFEDVFYVLSRHPKTKDIFSPSLGVKRKETFKTIFSIFKEFSFASVDVDFLGDAYEAMKKKYMTNKVLGQFFTPPDIKDFLIQEICPQLFSDGTCETFFDPTMGTGGFLLSAINHLKRQSEHPLNMDFIQSNIGGNEIHEETFKLANANLLIRTGHLYQKFQLKDSIRDQPDKTKYDIVLSNPPFGMKIKKEEVKKDYLPIETTGTFLFIQSIIYHLKIGGRAAVVLPLGQELFGKTFVNCRESFLKSCDLQKVILFPGGMFSNTCIKTCAFIFYKRKDILDVLQTAGKKRKYNFISGHATSSVEFLQYDADTRDTTHLVHASIEQIEKKGYSLDYSSYIEKVGIQGSSNYSFEIKTLGEVCELKKGTKLDKKDIVEGPYPVVGGGEKTLGMHSDFNVNERTILISVVGKAGYISRYDSKVFAHFNAFYMKNIKEQVSPDYLFHLLKHMQDDIYKLQHGTCQPCITQMDLYQLQIPIPSIERQLEIVEYLDFLNRDCGETAQTKIAELKKSINYILDNEVKCGKFEVKTLGEVCELKSGKSIGKKSDLIAGEYPVVGGGENIIGTHNEYNVEANTILISRQGSAGYVSRYEVPVLTTEHVFSLRITSEVVLNDYLFYLLKEMQEFIYSLRHGACQPGINKTDLYQLQIPIPPLERQLEIVDYCLKSSTLIASLEEEMERNKVQTSRYLSSLFSF